MDSDYQLRPLTGMDYIHSLLIDNPDLYYVFPNGRSALIYLPDRNRLFTVHHDFTWMTDDEIHTFLFHLKRGIL